jgi:hypothetical protein
LIPFKTRANFGSKDAIQNGITHEDLLMCHKHQSPKNGKHAFIIVSICALIVTKSKNWVMGQTISKLLQEEAN